MTGTPSSKRYERLVAARDVYDEDESGAREDESGDQASAPAERPSFKLRGGTYTLLVVNGTDLIQPGFFEWLGEKTGQAPNFYRDAPVALDLDGLPEDHPLDFTEIVGEMRRLSLVAVGVQSGSDERNRAAAEAGLSVFPMWRASKPLEAGPRPRPTQSPERKPDQEQEQQPEPQEEAPKAAHRSSMVVTQPIRSGRQVYAQNSDLIILSTAGAGSELLADGHIHVYGTIRGRVLAGVSGDTSARIFCDSLQAELVSVAGHWLVREDMDDKLIGRAVQIYLKGDLLVIEPMR